MLNSTAHPSRRSACLRTGLVLFALCVVASPPRAAGQQDVRASLIAPAERKPAPAFHLVGEDGQTRELSSYRRRVVLLNFWATTCGGCILEIPSFEDIQRTFHDQGFTALGISADIPYEGLKTPAEAWQRVRPFIASHQINYPILMGTSELVDRFGFNAYPATFLLDKSGRIAATYIGVVNKGNVEENLKALLAERP